MAACLKHAVFAAVLFASGCAEFRQQDARLAALRASIAAVTRAGAYACAPRELALAVANTEFAAMEIAQGCPQRADQHLDLAEENVGAAQVRSPRARCQRRAIPVPDLSSTAPADRDGDRIPDRDDRCPDEPEDWDGTLDADGCIDADDDGDSIEDVRDACPQAAEDRDGFRDDDGCPDPDNDADGIEDALDACPDVAGSGALSGCPTADYPHVTITEHELRLDSPIVFEGDTATIRSVAFPILDSVVNVLRDRTRITLEIGAHTDSRGDDASNLLLSQARADAVRSYMIERGVDPARLTARGYGETRPIESNSTSRGRAINQRVEFVRTDRTP